MKSQRVHQVPVGRAAPIRRTLSYTDSVASQFTSASEPLLGDDDENGFQLSQSFNNSARFSTSIFVEKATDTVPLLRASYGDEHSRNWETILKRGLRSVTELPARYRSVFSQFSHFNTIQSRVLDDVLYTDKSLVLSAPTGSGKTVVFELAIIRLLASINPDVAVRSKIVYMAPIKALCTERQEDWTAKFGPLGLKSQELTGDSEMDDYFELQDVNIILTTPEKWDSMTRRWRDNKSLVQMVRLFLIDEVHLLNDDSRGATLEAVVSRMKTVHASLTTTTATKQRGEEDAISCSVDDSERPVKLRQVVLAYPDVTSDFRFDMSLNYKLNTVIHQYSNQKPTLIFCSTRKSVQQAATVILKESRFAMTIQQRQRLSRAANALRDSKLREMVIHGVAFHHAGMELADRRTVEEIFSEGSLPVLLATSTLAMGVNLPAHLVIVKSTQYYAGGVCQDYTESQVLQMIGRAGRPQFDDTSTAVIMTKRSTKSKYENLLSGTQTIESSLHKHLIEHLNAEIVLETITDVSVALQWLKSTFLFIRIQRNPIYYGLPEHLAKSELEKKLQDWCMKDLNSLKSFGLVEMSDGFDLKPAEPGSVMARCCVAFESMKKFINVGTSENVNDLIEVIASCKELEEVRLRVGDKRTLNALNKNKTQQTIKYPIDGKIKTTQMKVNCLIQATFGCLPVTDFSLSQDVVKIFRSGSRLARALCECVMLRTDCYRSLVAATTLATCCRARLWENSPYVARQLERVGVTMATALVNAGLTTFEKIANRHPRELELIVNRHTPFGNQIRDSIYCLPQYELIVEQIPKFSSENSEIVLKLKLRNRDYLKKLAAPPKTFAVLLVGDADNRIVFKQILSDTALLREEMWSKRIEVQRATAGDELDMRLINKEYVGLDVNKSFVPRYIGPRRLLCNARTTSSSFEVPTKRKTRQGTSRRGAQRENDIEIKVPLSDVPSSVRTPQQKRKKANLVQNPNEKKLLQTKTRVDHRKRRGIESHLCDLQSKSTSIPQTPFKRLKKFEWPQEPISYRSLTSTKTIAQPYFDCLSYTPITQQQHLSPISVSASCNKVDVTQSLHQLLIHPTDYDCDNFDDFALHYDDSEDMKDNRIDKDPQWDSYTSDIQPSYHITRQNVTDIDRQYFEKQKRYEISYLDNIDDFLSDDNVTFDIDEDANVSFDFEEWTDAEDSHLQSQRKKQCCSRPDWTSSAVPAKEKTYISQLRVPKCDSHHLQRDAEASSSTHPNQASFGKENIPLLQPCNFVENNKKESQNLKSGVSFISEEKQHVIDQSLKCKYAVKSAMSAMKLSASKPLSGPSYFCVVPARTEDVDEWEEYDGLFDDIFD
ncbi:probable ATP-dependent DNA helicase HFM1 isoform X2 [Corticium candelabrum]|uniref:probable ATP-dependent DNA helicase HFM1 isoform X2 n=1 Tax=Corticium candelabrum TaxID=121492 RepID=UPI002E267BFD|nr:probable ATP-dependent DNA helicase HFM1 isoform X2 [Corticium candelabrum]